MSRRATAGGSSSSSASSHYVDTTPHPGFINLGNTCFLNSVLQATSATQSLKQLYHPQDLLDESTSELLSLRKQLASQDAASTSLHDPAFAQLVEQLSARSKSPVLQLLDEEHKRFQSYPSSRRASATAEHMPMTPLLEPPEVSVLEVKSTDGSTRTSIDGRNYEPTSVDLPLNTAFRQLLEKSWTSEENKAGSSSKNNVRKAPALNPKRLLTIMASKYDQYGDYAQQDGHELLRHLLDSLRMEELDVIKKIQPPSSLGSKRGHRNRSTAKDMGKTREETLRPFVDNLFCGKLLSCVVCEGCRHVSHTYEDFYDISLSLRPDIDAKGLVKRDRMKSMADRWKRATTSKGVANSLSTRPANDSVTSLRDDLVGSLSDTEEVGQNIKSAKSVGGGINRPKSAAAGQNAAAMDANSRESAKTFMIKNLQPEILSPSVEAEMESLSIQGDEKKANHGGAVALLRAVSSRSRSRSRTGPSSRGPSPNKSISEEVNHLVEEDGGPSQNKDHHHYRHLLRHEHKPKQSKHGAYLAKLLTEAPQPTPLAPTSALLWGRKTPNLAEQVADKGRRNVGEGTDIESQQAMTGLVRALNQFTSVEVLDGPNSFACKRCWRLMNPPSAEEEAKLRLRRMRRGKDEDESERSSDDESSSNEEEKEKFQREETSHMNSSSASVSLTSDNDAIKKQSRPPVNPHADWTKTVTPGDVSRQSVPSIETSSPQSSLSNGKISDSGHDSTTPSKTPLRMPMLQAPKAITASSKGLVLGESLSGTSSDEETNDEREEEEEEDGPKVKRAASVKFEDRRGTMAKQRGSLPMSKGVTKKRSTHSLQRRALKRFLIANTPRVLVFHFKRFQASSRGFNSYSFSNSFKKIDDYVSFPEYLDVKSWLAPPREEYNRHGRLKNSSDARALAKHLQENAIEDDHSKWHSRWAHKRRMEKDTIEAEKLEAETKTKYRLYAVVVHQGSMSGGHYTAYVLSDRIHDPKKAKILDSSSNTPTNLNSFSTSQLQSDGKKVRSSVGTTVADSTSTSLANEASLRSSLSMSSMESSGNGASSDGNHINSQVAGSEAAAAAAESNLSLSKSNSPASDATSKTGNSGAASSVSKTSESQASKGANLNDSTTSIPPLKPAEKKTDDRKWIYCSDTMVRGATLEEVLKAQAYMLFYEQM